VTTGAGKAGKARKAGILAIFLNWAGKAGKPLLFSDREAGKAGKPSLFSDREAGKAGISTFEILKNFNCFLE